MPGSAAAAAAAAFPPAGCAAAARRRRAARNGSPPAPGPRCHLLGEGGAQPGAPRGCSASPGHKPPPRSPARPGPSPHDTPRGRLSRRRRAPPRGRRRGGLEGRGAERAAPFCVPLSRRLPPPLPHTHTHPRSGHLRALPAVPRRRHSRYRNNVPACVGDRGLEERADPPAELRPR
ncbi:atherin-like isoform X2 [Aquila chrysaetos chrysaetos]|uniref:atherin-like isoform X2 n=1 Tax=Aquila chrysaetos chrysaetos TaxID=223781 RepID=UPI0011772EEA|nr:atherin-like isoform X2 [Aquila chrysaetos chrysaetos]